MTTESELLKVFLWLGLVFVIAGLDRALLAAERRGLVYYRTVRPVRGVSTYHLNELSEMLGGHGLPEIREERQEPGPGAPPCSTREE